MNTIGLTMFQAEEIGGLLDNVADQNDIATTDEDRMVVWGTLVGPYRKRTLVVLDPDNAIDDLEHRAEFMIQESDQWGPSVLGGYSGARSLRLVVEKIRSGVTSRE